MLLLVVEIEVRNVFVVVSREVRPFFTYRWIYIFTKRLAAPFIKRRQIRLVAWLAWPYSTESSKGLDAALGFVRIHLNSRNLTSLCVVSNRTVVTA